MSTDERIDKLTLTISDLAGTVDRLATAIAQLADRTLQRLDEMQTATAAAIAGLEQRAIAASIANEQRANERARDTQTEILRGIEAFARGNFSRMHRLETSDAATNARIEALEERVLHLETRRPPH